MKECNECDKCNKEFDEDFLELKDENARLSYLLKEIKLNSRRISQLCGELDGSKEAD